MNVKNLMTEPAITISASSSILDAAKLMKEKKIGFLPILKNGFLFGVITDRDLVIRAIVDNKLDCMIESIATLEPLTISKDDNVVDAAKLMRDNSIRRLVVTENAKVIGVITSKNLISNSETIKYVLETYDNNLTAKDYQIFINGNPHDSVNVDDYEL